MNLDKHDLMRNALPGYVFLLAICVIKRAANYSFFSNNILLILLSAGFPIGYLLAYLYRFLFHITVFGCTCRMSEQQRMEEQEAKLVIDVVSHYRHNPSLKEVKLDRDRNLLLSNLLVYTFYKSENNMFQERCDHLVSQIHSLGASSLGLVLAIFYAIHLYPNNNWSRILLAMGGCIVTAAILYLGRKKIFKSYIKARIVFAEREAEDLNAGYTCIEYRLN